MRDDARSWSSIVTSFVLGVAVALGLWLAVPAAEEPGRAEEVSSAPSAHSHAMEANLTEEQVTAIATLVVEGRATGAVHGLIADDPHGFDYEDMPWNGKRAIDVGNKQTKVTFSIDRWIKGSSPKEIYLLVYHRPDGSGGPPFVTPEFIDAVLAQKRIRVWANDTQLHPLDGTHWWGTDAVVID